MHFVKKLKPLHTSVSTFSAKKVSVCDLLDNDVRYNKMTKLSLPVTECDSH